VDIPLVEDHVIVPILPNGVKRDGNNTTTVPGGRVDLPSKVEIFLLEPATAIPVHKSQGRTLDKAILAQSHKQGMKCNL
jgi:hypothetical protein